MNHRLTLEFILTESQKRILDYEAKILPLTLAVAKRERVVEKAMQQVAAKLITADDSLNEADMVLQQARDELAEARRIYAHVVGLHAKAQETEDILTVRNIGLDKRETWLKTKEQDLETREKVLQGREQVFLKNLRTGKMHT